jgi:hypothetical protein
MTVRAGWNISAALVLGMGCIAAAFAGIIDEDSVKVRFHGYMGFETQEILIGRFRAQPYIVDHRWGGNTIGNLTADVTLSERSRLILTLEGRWWLGNYPQELVASGGSQQWGLENYSAFYVYQAQGIYSILKGEDRSLEFSFGIIPYKYNPEVKNLGEYLFRSLSYPGIIFNNFDFPMTRLSGLRLNFKQHTSIGDLTADAFVLSEREIRPFGDISFAGVVDFNFNKIVDIGLGVNLFHAIPANNRITTPGAALAGNATVYAVSGDSLRGYDSSFYTFSGTKLMGRITLDPLFFLRSSDFGRLIGEGGKIYGEANILGLKNYPRNDTLWMPDSSGVSFGMNPYGYDTLMNKMPITFGINIPVPYLLDECALEFEYYRMRYPNNYHEVFVYNRPLPASYFTDLSVVGYPPNTYSKSDNWKWSIYLKKNITKNFHIVFQAARDHQRWAVPGFVWGTYADWEDICTRPNNWIWNLKGEVVF